MNDMEVSCAKYRKQIETAQKQNKELHQLVKDLQIENDEKDRRLEDLSENTVVCERRSNLLQDSSENYAIILTPGWTGTFLAFPLFSFSLRS